MKRPTRGNSSESRRPSAPPASSPSSRRRPTPSHEEEEEEEEDAPPARRRGAPAPPAPPAASARRGRGAPEPAKPAAPAVSGWAKLQQRKDQRDAERGSDTRDFWLKDGEFAHIQLLHDEPYVYDSYSIKNSQGKYIEAVSQRETQDHCLLEQAGLRSTTKAAWLVLDLRGEWDKKKEEFTWEKPQLKVFKANLKTAQQLEALRQKRKKNLSEMVIDIQRTGAGTQTSYNVSVAFDDEADAPVKPIKHKEKLPDITEVIRPFTDEQLIAMGFGSGGNYEDENAY